MKKKSCQEIEKRLSFSDLYPGKKFLEFLSPLPGLMINEPCSIKATGDEWLKSNHQN